MERRFQTKDELEHFDFEDAVLEEVECACGRVKVMIDNVKILPDNSMNRDIRTMRANQMEDYLCRRIFGTTCGRRL